MSKNTSSSSVPVRNINLSGATEQRLPGTKATTAQQQSRNTGGLQQQYVTRTTTTKESVPYSPTTDKQSTTRESGGRQPGVEHESPHEQQPQSTTNDVSPVEQVNTKASRAEEIRRVRLLNLEKAHEKRRQMAREKNQSQKNDPKSNVEHNTEQRANSNMAPSTSDDSARNPGEHDDVDSRDDMSSDDETNDVSDHPNPSAPVHRHGRRSNIPVYRKALKRKRSQGEPREGLSERVPSKRPKLESPNKDTNPDDTSSDTGVVGSALRFIMGKGLDTIYLFMATGLASLIYVLVDGVTNRVKGVKVGELSPEQRKAVEEWMK